MKRKMWKKIVRRLLKRFSEPSTYAGMGVIAMAFGIGDAEWATYSVMGMKVATVMLILLGGAAVMKKDPGTIDEIDNG